ncbi:nucleotidyl transferase AbiEii/AbiGii toxin family protein [Pseudarthrobacter sp. AL07]|uniref:nucleotidyl transferase AbiEii/AbiGii toxin family protein n=1 Tax=unclassified Pseudarthrobacter TaxID=2647000 RepID=UPI00249A58A7|nr:MULTISPECIES: nucleotidyl transferase AbiEii/AbiGii toxin family protein [unclassified Pseudarthrobacter]MDI3194604.1 nucleotidyl transferase AbiEii/AbiGii toxin family protein [Pseudarthrobacter sp. AL20]MDI3208671.1 nucleotidyl transferase AbiEii/AbiGii toxin family protein [Pseudarthrobacter sp. AL07]
MDDSQRVAAKLALAVLAADGFVLAGGQALFEHGITQRPSEDIDLFALHRRHTPATFAASVQKMTDALEDSGYTVEITRQYDGFASVTVGHDQEAVVIDLGLDWWENSPAIIDIGPILSLKDSVASKLLAVYGRGYARDYLDAYSIISSRRFTHQELIRLCQRRDPHLDLPLLAASITRHRALPTTEFIKYGLPPSELPTLSSTLLSFAETIHKAAQTPSAAHNAPDLLGPGNAEPGPELL